MNNETQSMSEINRNDDYSDIIGLPWPGSSTRTRMAREKRAAQFTSFDALQGFNDEIEETAAGHAAQFSDDPAAQFPADHAAQFSDDPAAQSASARRQTAE